MSELNDFQKWCKEILPIVQAAANGSSVDYFTGGEWHEKTTSTSLYRETKYRIKPRTIKVNGFEIAAPMSEAPEEGTEYFVANTAAEEFCGNFECECEEIDAEWLSRGILHTTKEAAIAHAKAMLGIDPNGGDE